MADSYFRESRDLELSIIYFLETQINANWTGITVVKAFTDAYKSALPVIAIELNDNISNRREVGSNTLNNNYTIAINIFAKSNGQRLDLADFIRDTIIDGCVYYEHSQTVGNPSSLTRTANGRVDVKRIIENNKIDFGEDTDMYDKFRHFISIECRKSE